MEHYSEGQRSIPVKLARRLRNITIACCFDSHPRIDSVFQRPGLRDGFLENTRWLKHSRYQSCVLFLELSSVAFSASASIESRWGSTSRRERAFANSLTRYRSSHLHARSARSVRCNFPGTRTFQLYRGSYCVVGVLRVRQQSHFATSSWNSSQERLLCAATSDSV